MATLTIADQILILKTRIEERLLIVYTNQSALMDAGDAFPKEYRRALKDEIKNHKTIIKEYKADLKKLKDHG